MLYTFAVCIQREYLTAFSQQMHQITPISASGIQHTHSRGNVSSKDLIEDINVDLSKLLLKG